MPTTISISSFSKEAASKTAGEKLKDYIVTALSSGDIIIIDFSNISRFASPFFNNSFASLALIYGFDVIGQIKLVNITETGRQTYETSLENARLLLNNPEFTLTIDKIINNTPKKVD